MEPQADTTETTDDLKTVDQLAPDDAAEMQIEEPAEAGVTESEPAPAPVTSITQDPEEANYKETDVFAWANNLVQYKDELKIELFFFNKNYVVYRTNMTAELSKQLEPLFIDEVLEYVLQGAEEGMIVRGFEEAQPAVLVVRNVASCQLDFQRVREV